MPVVLPLIDLLPLIMFVGGLIFCLLCLYIAKGLFGAAGSAVGWIPGVGGWLKGKVEDVAHKITSELGKVVTNLEARIGASWHALARHVDWLGREIARHADLLLRIAHDLVTANIVDLIRLEVQGAKRLLHAFHKQFVGIGHDITIRVKNVERGIGADVLPRIRSLDRRLSREITREKARARTAEHALEREVTALGKWVRSHPWTVVTDAFIAAVAVALARLGLSWARCNPFQQNAKALCSSHPDWWADLLAGAIAIIGSVSVVEFTRDAQAVETEALDALGAFIREMPRA